VTQERTSTTVSRSAEGLLMPSAVLKWSLETAMELRISASISSSSRSMTSIFSRMHCSAASVHSAARSAPTYLLESRSEDKSMGCAFERSKVVAVRCYELPRAQSRQVGAHTPVTAWNGDVSGKHGFTLTSGL